MEPSLCHVSEWADVALPLQVQVCRCNLEGFNARRGACGWSHRFSVVSNQIWVAHVDDVDYNVLERFASPALGFLGHVEASYIYLKNFRFRIATAGVQHLWRYGPASCLSLWTKARPTIRLHSGLGSGFCSVSDHFQTQCRWMCGHVLANMPTFLLSSFFDPLISGAGVNIIWFQTHRVVILIFLSCADRPFWRKWPTNVVKTITRTKNESFALNMGTHGKIAMFISGWNGRGAFRAKKNLPAQARCKKEFEDRLTEDKTK